MRGKRTYSAVAGYLSYWIEELNGDGNVKTMLRFFVGIWDITGGDQYHGILHLHQPVDSQGHHLIYVIPSSTVDTSLDLGREVGYRSQHP
jgi:hypothetical protein